MARQVALVTSWTYPARGREKQALEVFMDYLTFFGKKAADGMVSEPETFFSIDGRKGFGIVKAPSDVIQKIIESEDWEHLMTRAQLTVEGMKAETFITGDEEIQRGTRIYAQAGTELGYMK